MTKTTTIKIKLIQKKNISKIKKITKKTIKIIQNMTTNPRVVEPLTKNLINLIINFNRKTLLFSRMLKTVCISVKDQPKMTVFLLNKK